ncbi:MauE/DoxX family redox-associated membrane protein [uncultured Algibacter sp.]|uniref:MauE/DoxX family redox-associated membrane protein n=1 Tax=uncultured Algibacter sp. TaxID=298659 RepID=UPI002632C5C3|nr:MauE/DoxX family redox-associated membrane protein [uncultured Algibacter sp.]
MMRSVKSCQLYLKTVRFLYIVLFVYTAVSKLINIEQFQFRLERFPFISTHAVWITWGIPILEILIAALFLFPKYTILALYSSLSLMSVFTIYILSVLKFGDSIPCSCGGVVSAMGWKEHIFFNGVFIAFSLIGILIIQNQKKTTNK